MKEEGILVRMLTSAAIALACLIVLALIIYITSVAIPFGGRAGLAAEFL